MYCKVTGSFLGTSVMDSDSNVEKIDPGSDKDLQVHHITTYKFAAGDNELHIKMLGKKRLSITADLPDHVTGTIKIDNMHIPVVDPNARRGLKPQKITDSSCVVLTAQHAGIHSVTTAAIYPDLPRVLEFILKNAEK